MGRLEQILGEIEKDAALQEERILADARERADARLKEAGEEADREAEEMIAAAREKAEREAAIARSGAEALRKKALLCEKSRILSETIDSYKASLLALPDQTYFGFFLDQIASLPTDGEIFFAAGERARDRALFARMLEETEKTSGKKWTVADQPADGIGSGFLVRYGKIEENLSLEAIFSSSADEMKDRLAAVLFKDAE